MNIAKSWAFTAVSALLLAAVPASAATITVNSLLDDVFPDVAGNITPALTAPKCTLRMAIASANLDLPVGGATNGCVAAASTVYITAGSDAILFDAAIAGGTILLDATQAMPIVNTTSINHILWITGPTSIDGSAGTANSITLDGGLTASNITNKRILNVAEVTPTATESRAGSSINADISSVKFQNAQVDSAGGCVLSFESLSLFAVDFTNCVVTNTPTTATASGGALFMRAADNNFGTFRPDARLRFVTFKGNKALAGGSATNPGGGAFFLGSSTGRMGHVALINVTVGGATVADQNYADGGYGGGSITRADSVSVSSSTFQGNVAQNGEVGGLRIGSMNGTSPVSILFSSFLDNKAKTGNGGLSVASNVGSTVALGFVTVSGNTAQFNGGVNLSNNLSVLVSDTTIASNVASSGVGGLNLTGNSGTVLLGDVEISNNRVTDGSSGGFNISSNTGVVQIRRTLIANNAVQKGTSSYAGNGGGAITRNTSVTMTDSTVSGNTSDFHVSALALGASFSPFDSATGLPVATLPPTTNSITFNRVTVSGNVTSGVAAGGNGFAVMYIDSPGIYTFLNSTITGNTVTGGCGGAFSIGAFNPSTQTNATRVVFRHSTLARNTATQCQEAGSIGAFNPAAPSSSPAINGSLVFESSVLGGRQATSNPVDIFFTSDPSKVTITNTLIENNGDSLSARCGLSGNICNVDAKLDALASHGGPTQTLRLLPGSPAINTGSNSTSQATDQRGAARAQGAAADMGAYETPAGSAFACNLDMDGDSLLSPTKEGLVLVRAMLGFSGSNVTAGTGLTASWATIRANLNANCGTNFAP
jgi:hypothetical protein